MLIEITLQNFKSFHEKVTISLRAGATTKLKGNLLRVVDGSRYLKSVALYGKNASGKTTILDALYALKSFVAFSSEDQKPTAAIPRFESFALSRDAKARPARVAITIYTAGFEYAYDVAATGERVWQESLERTLVENSYRKKREPARRLIERRWCENKKSYETFISPEIGPPSTIEAGASQTPPNRLVLGKLAALNSEIATQVLEWFEQYLDFYDMHRNSSAEDAMLQRAAKLFKSNKDFSTILTRFLADADTGIESLSSTIGKQFSPVFDADEQRFEVKEVSMPELNFHHSSVDGYEVAFRKNSESSGTLRFIAMLAAIVQPCKRPRTVCVDELSASLHPDLVAALVKIVHSKATNPAGSQLLFTTHDTHLMDPGSLLRRDQIVLCEKNPIGESTAFRLDDFQDDARSDANLQKQYMQNRFGGKPQFGPSLEDIPGDEMPLEVAR
ncbi:MAG: AAA family ATPase [Planctomycetaceae bacterium]|nr:AAA family ATPase [Planctomycetaceae bacterium]